MKIEKLLLLCVILLLEVISESKAWERTNFSINSKLPKICGINKNYSPENTFELWTSWPWLGMLFFNNGIINLRCNSVLIHPEAAISSLECVKYIPNVVLKNHLYIGFSYPGQMSFQNISVTHIDFTGSSYNTGKDIALMKLERPIIVSPDVQPICMWEEQHEYSQQISGHIGMMIGSDFDNVYKIHELRVYQAPVKILSEEKCKSIDQDFYNKTINPGICYTYLRNRRECHAIGSLLMLPRLGEDANVIWYLRGMFTHGGYSACDKTPFLPAFDMADHRTWIESHFKSSTEDTCGRRKVSHLSLVVLGEEATRGDWPWHAALFYKNRYRCGATLISANTLLTAAHCLYKNIIYKIPDSTLSISLGKHHLKIKEHGEIIFKSIKTIVHPEYDTTTLQNDIAIIKLYRPVSFSDHIQPACLWDENDIKKEELYYKEATVVGWGINENGTASHTLHVAKVPIADDLTCLQSHPTFYNNFLNDETFCAGNPFDDASNVCNGDSGGGLMIPQGQADLEDTWYIRGIVSVTVPKDGTRKCDPTKFTVYTDVAQYLPWIKENLRT